MSNKPDINVMYADLQRLKEEFANITKKVNAMSTTDALQNQKLSSLAEDMSSVNKKLDTVVEFITETKGGKKWTLGILALIGTVMGIAVSYFKLNP